MGKSYRKIIYLLIIVIILPVSVFTIYEISSLNKNEEVIQDIYIDQLETVLFSINQYTQDVINNWVNEVNIKYHFVEPGKIIENKPGLTCFFSTSVKNNSQIIINNCNGPFHELQKIINANNKKIKKLEKLYENGFRKIEPIAGDEENILYLFFYIDNNDNPPILSAFKLNATSFIQNILSPRIQATLQGQFVISVKSIKNNSIIYNSLNDTTLQIKNIVKNELWLLPGYEFGISLRGKTIEEVVKKRTKTDLIIIVILDLILLIGAIYLYSNIRKEVKLTQIKSEFISNVSHEIRTPLALISMYIETLEMGRIKTPEKINEYYRIISQETTRLSGMVNKILNFSKIENGTRKLNLERLDINETVMQVMKSYSFHLESKSFEYVTNLKSNIPLVYADKELITDCLINLVDNAIKYSAVNKYIEINTGLKNNYVFIEVTDKGLGIPKEKQKLVFDKFYRVTEGNLAHKAKGSGLGLSIVKSNIDAHQGKIELESTPGIGSTFRILLNQHIKKSKNV